MRNLKWLFAFLIIGIFSCSQESDGSYLFDLGAGEIQMHYLETQCADPWYTPGQNQTEDSQNVRISGMVSLLEQKGVNVLAVSYEFDQDAALACLACDCQTGGIFYVKIENESDAIQVLLELGFNQ